MFYKKHPTIAEFLQALDGCGAVVRADGRGDCVRRGDDQADGVGI